MKRYIAILSLIIISCSQNKEPFNMNKEQFKPLVNIADIKKIASKKIYFGHMSVGYNIIDAFESIVPAGSGLTLMETCDSKNFNKPVFAHSKNGENKKPETKISAFVEKMD